jgi:hypothetical protein
MWILKKQSMKYAIYGLEELDKKNYIGIVWRQLNKQSTWTLFRAFDDAF